MTGLERGWSYCGGLDLGVKRDNSAFAVIAYQPGTHGPRSLRLADLRMWRPVDGAGGKVDLTDVEEYIRVAHERLGLDGISFDPWNCELLASRIEASIEPNRLRSVYGEPFMREVTSSGANLRDQASITIEAFKDRRLWMFPCDELRRDLHRLRVVERQYGFRLESPRTADGHGDSFSAFALALQQAVARVGKPVIDLSPQF